MIPRFTDGRLRLLISYHYAQGLELDAWLEEHFGRPYPELFFDSGAYSAYTKGERITPGAYGQWLYQWKHLATTYANLDVIGDANGTVENQRILEEMGLNPLPVFHGGSPMSLLDNLVEKYNYMAIGGLVGVQGRSNELMRNLALIFRKTNDKIAAHGFGAVDFKMQKSFRWYSADSTTWLNGHRYGKIRMFDPMRSRIIDAKCRTPKDWGRYAIPLRAMGLNWRDWAYQKNYAPHKDNTTKLAIIAYKTLEQFITDIWKPFPIPENGDRQEPCGTGPGPKIYLAVTAATARQYLSRYRPKRSSDISLSKWLAGYAETGDFFYVQH